MLQIVFSLFLFFLLFFTQVTFVNWERGPSYALLIHSHCKVFHHCPIAPAKCRRSHSTDAALRGIKHGIMIHTGVPPPSQPPPPPPPPPPLLPPPPPALSLSLSLSCTPASVRSPSCLIILTPTAGQERAGVGVGGVGGVGGGGGGGGVLDQAEHQPA